MTEGLQTKAMRPVGRGDHAIAAEIAMHKFFHDMQIGSVRTGTWVYAPEYPPNYHLFPVFHLLKSLDLSKARCLDIGTYDGMTAFVLSQMDAQHVDATCQYDQKQFRLIHELLRSKNLTYHSETHLDDLLKLFDEGSFDLVIISAMLHHLMSPLDALFISRRLLKQGGYLILEAAVRDSEEPILILNTETSDPVYGNPTVWIPSTAALIGMAKLAAFDVDATISLTGTGLARESNYERMTLLCRAEQPSAISERRPQLQQLHAHAKWTGAIDFRKLEKCDDPRANIEYSGPKGRQELNLWTHIPAVPMQPKWQDPKPERTSGFRIGTNDVFLRLMGAHERDHWNAKDITLLAAKYPGEIFPEGQAWSLKQFGNLFCLDFIKRWGLHRVLEVGPGFNHYFENHLPPNVDYWLIDEPGFYNTNLIGLANGMRKRSTVVDGLIGKSSEVLPDSGFDGIFSVSVIEHIPVADVDAAARDMFRVLRPGGWCVHSLDLKERAVSKVGEKWKDALLKAGFILDLDAVDLDAAKVRAAGQEMFIEPLSIVQRFHGGYRPEPWKGQKTLANRIGTVLVAVRKPMTVPEEGNAIGVGGQSDHE